MFGEREYEGKVKELVDLLTDMAGSCLALQGMTSAFRQIKRLNSILAIFN